MIKRLQDIFIDTETGSQLAYTGDFKGDRWNNGVLTSGTGKQWAVIYGVPDFVRNPNDVFGNQCIQNSWIQKNWEITCNKDRHYKDGPYRRFAKEIADNEGVILEVATGPSGGNASCILQYDPDATILMNDISFTLLNGWRSLLERESYEKVSFAAFDARKMPLTSRSIDVVSDFCGITNVASDVPKVISEIYRILKSGGALYSTALKLVEEDVEKFKEKLPDDLVTELERISSFEKMVTNSDFKVERTEHIFDFNLDPENNGIAKSALKYGVQLKGQLYQYVLVKP